MTTTVYGGKRNGIFTAVLSSRFNQRENVPGPPYFNTHKVSAGRRPRADGLGGWAVAVCGGAEAGCVYCRRRRRRRETIKQINSRPVRRRIFNYRPPKMMTPPLETAVLLRALLSPFRSPRRAVRSDFYCALEKSPRSPRIMFVPGTSLLPGAILSGYIAVVPVSPSIRETADSETDSAVFDVPPPRVPDRTFLGRT